VSVSFQFYKQERGRGTWKFNNSLLREEKIKGLFIRAKWQVEGEKSTNYFCNLEKRHFTEKPIPKLIVENNEITDLSQIIKEQANFNTSLYSTNENTSHRHELSLIKQTLFLTS
jgi:hypothetical protein